MVPRGCRLRVAVFAAWVAVALWSSPARADTADDEHTYQTWMALFAHGPLKGNLWLWSDVQLRLYESFEPTTVILRPGLTWRVTPSLFLTAGYGWTPGWARTEGDRSWGDLTFVDEHRAWQQVLWAPVDPATGVAAQVRVRFEQRFRPGSSDVGARLRVLWRGQAPISRNRLWMVVVWNELFVAAQDTDWGQRAGFDQNRAFVGFARQVLPAKLRLEAGYQNKWTIRQGPDTIDHILALSLFLTW